MKPARKLIASFVVLLAVGSLFGFLLYTPEPVEPQFLNTPLSRWFARFCLRNRAQMRAYDSVGALRALGTNTLAYLIMLDDSPTNRLAFDRLELQAQREVGDGDRPWERVEHATLRLIDPRADSRLAIILDPPRIQESVYAALSFLKPDAAQMLPFLTERLQSPLPRQRERALTLLSYAGKNVELAEPLLIRGLADENEACRAAAAEAIGWSGQKSPTLVTPLIAALENSSPGRQGSFIWAVGKMGPEAVAALPTLVAMLARETNARPRIVAAGAIRAINPDQPEAFGALIEGLTDPNSYKLALASLGQWRAKTNAMDALPILLRVLKSDTYFARRVLAAENICQLEPTQPDALKVLIEALADRNLRRDITPVVAGLRPRPIVPASVLIDSLPDEDLIYDRPSFDLFLTLGDQRGAAIASLTNLLATAAFRPRLNAATALLRLEPNHADALATIIRHLEHSEYPGWVVRSADALGVAGTNATAALPALNKQLQVETPPVSEAIKAAIERISPSKPESGN